MTLALIGSQALKAHGFERNPIDVDVMGDYSEVEGFFLAKEGLRSFYPVAEGRKVIAKGSSGWTGEGEIAWEGSAAEHFIELASQDEGSFEKDGILIPSLNALYALKMSHRYLKNSPHFLKTMRDIREMRAAGAEISEEYADWFARRERETYDYAHPSLMVSKGDFFAGDGVDYVFDHDSLHEAMRHLDKPAYRYYMMAGMDVMCDKDKFFETTEEVRLYGVLEEAYVLALERSQIPFGDSISPRASFDIALMKICTSVTSGWFREFAWENYETVSSMFDEGYVEKFKKAERNGVAVRNSAKKRRYGM